MLIKDKGSVKQSPVPKDVKAEEAVRDTEPVKKKKRLSRADQWMEACAKLREGLDDLQNLKSDFESWRDNMPESLQVSETYQKLETICDLDLDGMESTLDEAEGIEIPLGFGRD